jgi:hypothetical protein
MDGIVPEGRTYGLKSRYDPGSAADRLDLIKQVVALANSGGGEIRFGSDEGSGPPGAGAAGQHFDAVTFAGLIDRYIAPDHVEISTSLEKADSSGGCVVVIKVQAQEAPPVVFSRDGRYRHEGREVAVFRRHTVVSCHGTKAELATRADYHRWTDTAVRAERRRILENLGLVVSLPPGAAIQVVTGSGEVSSEPRVLLDRSVRSWRADPSKLLSRQDLLVLFLSRRGLTLERADGELVLHSALRRRPTLWFWVDSIHPDAAQLARVLLEAVAGSDRDRSDAASSIIDLSALLLDPARHEEIVAALGSSRYKHFHDAATRGGDRNGVLTRLDRLRDRRLGTGPLRTAKQNDIEATADELGRALLGGVSSNTAANRLLGPLGFELMLRHRPELISALGVAPARG